MAEWSVRIGGENGFVISKDTVHGRRFSFLPQARAEIRPDGAIEGIDWQIDVTGSIVSASVHTDMSELLDVLRNQAIPVQVEILRDGTLWEELLPGDCLWGPYVREVSALDDAGGGESHWGYVLRIIARRRGEREPTVYNLETELEVETSTADEVVRKVWRASAKAKTYQAALAVVRGFKPSGKVKQVERYSVQKAEASAEWTWEREKAGIRSIRCTVTGPPNGRNFVTDPQVNGNVLAHALLDDAAYIEVYWEIISVDPQVVPLDPHFEEGQFNIRCRALETRGSPGGVPEVHDTEKGLWILRGHEVWRIIGPQTDLVIPDHRDHNTLGPGTTEPGDGAVAG